MKDLFLSEISSRFVGWAINQILSLKNSQFYFLSSAFLLKRRLSSFFFVFFFLRGLFFVGFCSFFFFCGFFNKQKSTVYFLFFFFFSAILNTRCFALYLYLFSEMRPVDFPDMYQRFRSSCFSGRERRI